MYIYNGITIKKPLYIHFLCGKKYIRKDSNDKRKILKEYIDQQENNYALILEQLFYPKEYEKMGFKDLEEVEIMASNYARSIIIFQETVSTAAEISLFASNKKLQNKVLIIYAPRRIVETDSVGAFIKLAYLNSGKITYSEYNFNPKLRTQDHIAYFDTYFYNNKIDNNFINILKSFWGKNQPSANYKIIKNKAPYKKEDTYRINKREKRISMTISYQLILNFLISILLNNDLVKDVRNLDEAISKICMLFQEIIKNTISNFEFQKLDSYTISIKTIDNHDINLPIRFCLYILKKSKLINIVENQISVSNRFKRSCYEYKSLLKKEQFPRFFGDDIYE